MSTATRFVVDVDGRRRDVDGQPLQPLRAALEALGIHGQAEACGVGACGACTVLLDGAPVRSCVVPLALAQGHAITTIDGLPEDDEVVAAFVRTTAYQCGMCIPGFVMATQALLVAGTTGQDSAAIEAGLGGHLCRCGTYPRIHDAVRSALGG